MATTRDKRRSFITYLPPELMERYDAARVRVGLSRSAYARHLILRNIENIEQQSSNPSRFSIRLPQQQELDGGDAA